MCTVAYGRFARFLRRAYTVYNLRTAHWRRRKWFVIDRYRRRRRRTIPRAQHSCFDPCVKLPPCFVFGVCLHVIFFFSLAILFNVRFLFIYFFRECIAACRSVVGPECRVPVTIVRVHATCIKQMFSRVQRVCRAVLYTDAVSSAVGKRYLVNYCPLSARVCAISIRRNARGQRLHDLPFALARVREIGERERRAYTRSIWVCARFAFATEMSAGNRSVHA